MIATIIACFKNKEQTEQFITENLDKVFFPLEDDNESVKFSEISDISKCYAEVNNFSFSGFIVGGIGSIFLYNDDDDLKKYDYNVINAVNNLKKYDPSFFNIEYIDITKNLGHTVFFTKGDIVNDVQVGEYKCDRFDEHDMSYIKKTNKYLFTFLNSSEVLGK